jgi:hypothetical protein
MGKNKQVVTVGTAVSRNLSCGKTIINFYHMQLSSPHLWEGEGALILHILQINELRIRGIYE